MCVRGCILSAAPPSTTKQHTPQQQKNKKKHQYLGAGQLREQARLADRGEADERDAAVAVLLNVEALAGAALGGRLLQLRAQLGEARLELAQVVLGRLFLVVVGLFLV